VKIEVTTLANAVQRLREGLARCNQQPNDEQLRDGLIQRFEFTYELSHKTLRRFLREQSASPDEVARLPFSDLIRIASEHGLVQAGWPGWRRFRDMRARTSHVYDAAAAMVVVAAIPEFLEEVGYLCDELSRRLQ
jgi:nucleotidyltransferase substrate binding protein (TIGR01987 family)